MDTKLLKQKILDLAIRGKLVPQDPNDEPASVLLERIRAEREQLIKQGKLKRSKSTSDNQHYQNVPFEIPASWEFATLELVCSKIGSGSTPRGSNYAASGIPFFRSQNVYDDGLVYDDIKFISEDIHQQMKSTEVLPNDVLLNITGGSLGRSAVVPSDFEKGNVSQHVCILRPIIVETQYLHCFILSGHFSQTMKVTGSGREGLPKYNLEKMIMPIPPLNEQRRIVTEVNRWFSLISDLERNESELNDIIKATKTKILNLAIHGKLVLQDPNDEPASELLKRIAPHATPCDTSHYENLPASWCVCKVETIADVISGVSYDKSDVQRSGIKILRGGNIQDGKIVEQDDDVYISEKYINESNSIKYGDIILVASTGSQTLIGKTGFAPKAYHHTQIGAFLRIIRAKDSSLCEYLNYVFLSDTFRKHIRELASGTNINNVKNKYITDFILALPPQNEIPRIIKKVNDIFKSLDTITAEL